MSALFEPRRELAAGGRFAGALQSRHKNDGGRLRSEFEACRVFAEELDQLVANDLDDLLRRRERGKYLGANGFGADVLDEFVDDVEVDVGVELGDADFAEGFADVFFSERALAAECLEGPLQFFCKVLKHRSVLSVSPHLPPAVGPSAPPAVGPIALARHPCWFAVPWSIHAFGAICCCADTVLDFVR